METGIGMPCQFKSSGVRMNVFLNSMTAFPSKFRYQASSVGDIRSLPECLMISYDDRSTDKWCFYLAVPANTYIFKPQSAIEQLLSTPVGGDAGPKSLFDQLLNRGPLPSSLRSPKSVSPREYLIEGGPPSATNPVGFTVFKDDEPNGKFFSGYAVVNGTMVWKIPTFRQPSEIQNDVINFWNAMIEEAEKQNAKKLIIDISENSGGALTNAFTAVQLLYPDAALDEIVHWFTGRISEPMLSLGNDLLPSFENLTSALLEKGNLEELVDRLEKVDNSDRSNAFSRIKNLVEISLALATGVGDGNENCQGIACLSNGGANDNWVNLDQNRFVDLVKAGQDLEDEWTSGAFSRISILNYLLENLQRSILRPSSCANVGEQCEVYKKLEGGVNATVSAYQKSSAYTKANYDLTKKTMRRAPFESYVLYSNAGIVGSAANMFESSVRALSKKYKGKAPRTVAVTSGCTGNREECPMSSFTGQIANSASFVGSFYAMYGVASVFEEILDLISDDVLDSLEGIDKKVVAEYKANMRLFEKKLPSPPGMALNIPQYNSKRVYNQMITRDTLPMEFWNIPPDEYIAVWPEPDTLSFTNQKSLLDIYTRLMAFF